MFKLSATHSSSIHLSMESSNAGVDPSSRFQQIPILHCRGSHRAVGFIIGRQFRGPISDLLGKWSFFNDIVLPAYATVAGREIFDTSLEHCKRRFPKYVQELEGMAQGSEQPFYKLFLLHLESTLLPADVQDEYFKGKIDGVGCTSFLCNADEVVLAHTEDTCIEFINNVYIVAAEILYDDGVTVEEKFTTLTYAGHLPGYTMGYNSAGLVHSVNTLYPSETYPSGTPRTFLARAILKARTLEEALAILVDEGAGVSDGFSLNLVVVNNTEATKFYNIEISPPNSKTLKSQSNLYILPKGGFYAHCNRYLRLLTPEIPRMSSPRRNEVIERYAGLTSLKSIKDILSDTSDQEYPIFRSGKNPDPVQTVAVGVFDIKRRTWSLYTDPPATSFPVAVIQMTFDI